MVLNIHRKHDFIRLIRDRERGEEGLEEGEEGDYISITTLSPPE